MVYTVIEIEYLNLKGSWEKQLNFYHLTTSIEISTDWRTKEVKNKRKQGIILGLVSNPLFPITYPFQLDNGYICNDIYTKINLTE